MDMYTWLLVNVAAGSEVDDNNNYVVIRHVVQIKLARRHDVGT